MKRGGEILLLLAARKHWPTFVPRVSRGIAMQEVLLHPEKEASEVPLSMSTWGHWCCPGLWDRASASSAAAFTGGGNAQSDNMRVFFTLIKLNTFSFFGKTKKGGDT